MSGSADVEVVVFGGGNMGAALVAGLVSSGWAPERLAVVDPDPAVRRRLEAGHPGLCALGSAESSPGATGAVLAVKQDATEAACRAASAAGAQRVLSLVAGLSTQRLEAVLPGGTPVVRAVPNTAALVGRAVTAISGGSHVTSADLDWAESLLSAVGTVVRLPERHLDAVTGLSGSGPAYLFVVAEALAEAGVLGGLPRPVAEALASGTLTGAAALLERDPAAAAELRAAVTSPGGTTAAGLRALEARAVRSAFIEAVSTATERSRQLGHAQA